MMRTFKLKSLVGPLARWLEKANTAHTPTTETWRIQVVKGGSYAPHVGARQRARLRRQLERGTATISRVP